MSIIRRPQPTAGAARPRKGAVPEAAAMRAPSVKAFESSLRSRTNTQHTTRTQKRCLMAVLRYAASRVFDVSLQLWLQKATLWH